MAENLFEGLPPPSSENLPAISHNSERHEPELKEQKQEAEFRSFKTSSNLPASSPVPVLKSALKRPKVTQEPDPEDTVPGKRLRFKTTTDASEKQVIEAMQKITSHIKNPTKFSKASKLAIQLIQAGSVKPGTSDYFFTILEAAMSSSTSCTDSSVRADYHALFSAAQDAMEHLNKKQKNQLSTWTIRAVMANDLLTDDSFVFSKTAGQVKEAISNLPFATEEDDVEEAEALKEEAERRDRNDQTMQDAFLDAPAGSNRKEDADPFGLDVFLSNSSKKGDKVKGRGDATSKVKKEEEGEAKRFLKSQREALIICLEIAARRYKTPWCQTVIDILVKHAFDNITKFTTKQRDAIEKLWTSIREQLTRRKQGKSGSGKLDLNGFERLQQKYASEKISIRQSVGSSGERKAQQWLG